MEIRKLFELSACVIFLICRTTAIAQEMDKEAGREMSGRQDKGFKPIPLSPEKSAKRTTDRMDSLLNLSEKQYGKLYKLNLKWAREDMEDKTAMFPMGDRPVEAPGFGGGGLGQGSRGNRPPQGMDRRPPRDLASSADKEDMEKKRKKREKKLKKILTDEQYARWTEDLRLAKPGDVRDRK